MAEPFPQTDAPRISGGADAWDSGTAGPILVDDYFAATLPGVSGTMAVQEDGADSFSASGTVTDAGVTGSLAAQESGADTFAANGSVSVSGSLSAQEAGSDAFAASGAVAVSGALSAQESGQDAFVASGSVPVAGALSAQEVGADVFAATGSVESTGVNGSLVAQETGEDTFAAVGIVEDRQSSRGGRNKKRGARNEAGWIYVPSQSAEKSPVVVPAQIQQEKRSDTRPALEHGILSGKVGRLPQHLPPAPQIASNDDEDDEITILLLAS